MLKEVTLLGLASAAAITALAAWMAFINWSDPVENPCDRSFKATAATLDAFIEENALLRAELAEWRALAERHAMERN